MTILAGESPSGAWKNHPAVKMFRGNEDSLYRYLMAIREEMKHRGYKWEKNWQVIEETFDRNFDHNDIDPEWMTSDEFDKVVITHRGRLYAKAPELYPQYETEYNIHRDYVCCENCQYYWVAHK